MDYSDSKARPRRGSRSNPITHDGPETPRLAGRNGPETPRQPNRMGPETPRQQQQQNRANGRGIARGNSSKSGFSARTDISKIYPDDLSRQSKGRRNSADVSELSGVFEADGCCNMKFSDLANENYRDSPYNAFEATIVEERRDRHLKHSGRSIPSIRKNPNFNTLSLSGLTKMTSSINQLRSMTTITDNILLGGRDDAENAARLLEHGVTHVLNTAQQLPNYFPQHFVYLKVGLIDATSANVVEVMDRVVSFLTHVERVKGRVLVHCLAGVSRSVSVILMHLMVRHRLPLQLAFRYVRSCRPQINPNEAFKLQLAKLELQELRCSSVARDADRIWDFYEWNAIKRSVPTSRSPDDPLDRAPNPLQLLPAEEGDDDRADGGTAADSACCLVS